MDINFCFGEIEGKNFISKLTKTKLLYKYFKYILREICHGETDWNKGQNYPKTFSKNLSPLNAVAQPT